MNKEVIGPSNARCPRHPWDPTIVGVGRSEIQWTVRAVWGTLLGIALAGCMTGLVDSTSVPDPSIEKPQCTTGAAIGDATVRYAQDLRPILTRVGCLASSCHGGDNPSVNFSLATYESMFAPGSGAILSGLCPIVPGNPDASYIIEKLQPNPRTGRQMPDRRPPLSGEEFQLFVTWIREGAANN